MPLVTRTFVVEGVLALIILLLAQADVVTAQSINIVPTADAYVESRYANSNFGTSAQLKADFYRYGFFSSDYQEIFMRFPLTSVPANSIINSAKLYLYATYPINIETSPHTIYNIPAANRTWTETGVTWNTKPQRDNTYPLITLHSVSMNSWAVADITSYVQDMYRQGIAAEFEIDGAGDGLTDVYNSKEASSNQPYLQVTYSPATTSTTTPTLTPTAIPTPALTSTTSGASTQKFNFKMQINTALNFENGLYIIEVIEISKPMYVRVNLASNNFPSRISTLFDGEAPITYNEIKLSSSSITRSEAVITIEFPSSWSAPKKYTTIAPMVTSTLTPAPMVSTPPPDTLPPSIFLSKPKIVDFNKNDQLEEGEKLIITYGASDESGIKSIRLLLDRNLIELRNNEGTYSVTTDSLSVGEHSIVVEATDSNGNKNTENMKINVARTGPSVYFPKSRFEVYEGEDVEVFLSAVNPIGNPKMEVLMILKPPNNGVSVYESDYCKGLAGMCTGSFLIDSGDNVRQISILMRADRTGEYNIDAEVYYQFENQRSSTRYETITLAVKPKPQTPGPAKTQVQSIPGFEATAAIALFVSMRCLKKRGKIA